MTRKHTATAIYYAGFDPGSGIAALEAASADTLDETFSLALPNLVGGGDSPALINVRSTTEHEATLACVLKKHEYVIEYERRDYYVGELAEREGTNTTNARGDKNRYWSLHNRLLLLTLSAALIPEPEAELRLVTALPVSLYTKENRMRVQRALEGHYPFCLNGSTRAITVKVGAVVMEGTGALIRYGEESGEQAVIDIGERTMDLIAASGQTPLARLCAGALLGVGQVTDELVATIKQQYGRVLSSLEAHSLLHAYAHKKPLPRISANQVRIPAEYLETLIERAITRVGRAISTFVSQTWNVEGGHTASHFSPILLIGGGAHYFEGTIRELIPLVTLPAAPESANQKGYLDLATGLEDVRPTIWELDRAYA